jgi:hypothetical protein
LGLLKTPTARLIAHTAIAFIAAFIPLVLATDKPLSKELLWGFAIAAGRLVLGLTTSTNPQVGKNVV